MSQLRQGDIALYNTPDGGEISIKTGEPVMDLGYESAVYISLFGAGEDKHWSEEYQTEIEKFSSEFYNFIVGKPKSVSNINRAEDLAKKDLNWFLVEGIADTLNVSITSMDKNKIELSYELLLDGLKLAENKYVINWGFEESQPAHERV